jgi:hypothetical protein
VEYMNARSVEIREHREGYPVPDNPPHSVTSIRLIEAREVNTRELSLLVRDAASRSGIGGYIVDDVRRYHEVGASGSGQDVILYLLASGADAAIGAAAGAATAFASGVAGQVAEEVLGWFRKQRRGVPTELADPKPEPTLPRQDLSDDVSYAKVEVTRIYGGSEDDLDVDEAARLSDGVQIRLTSKETGTSYRIRLSGDPGSLWVVHVEKLRAS